jgi:general secretion pathway protein A
MYKDYFGLREHPFSIAPDPRYLYMSEGHREALAHLLYGIGDGGGFILLTGEVGTGKTTVCRCLLEQVPPDTDVAFILNPPLTVDELLAAVCDELGIRYPEGNRSAKVFVDLINRYLLDAHARGRKTVLILEEAQNLGVELLEQVRLLTNLETNRRKLLQIIMLGQPELRALLQRPDMRQLSQRITARYHLGALCRRETEAYVSHRLAVAGTEEKLFSVSALNGLHRLSGGIPRLINLICDRTLLGAYCEGRRVIDGRTVSKASQEILGFRDKRGVKSRIMRVALALLVLILCGAGFGAFYHTPWVGRTEPVSKARAVEPRPEVQSVEWPADLPIDKSPMMAYQAMLALWGVPYDGGSVCSGVKSHGLACLEGEATMETLTELNRPVMLKLSDPEGANFFVLLKELRGKTATVVVGDREKRVDLEQIEKKWLGDYTILWKVPPGYDGDILPGAGGHSVQWLDELMARLQGGSSRGGKHTNYDAALVAQVRKFQLSKGLVPDGIVGPQTVIELMGDSADGPRLKREEEKKDVLYSGRPEKG